MARWRNTSSPMKPDEEAIPDYMEATRMSFGDHLEELRLRLLWALAGLVVAAVGGFLFAKPILSILFQPLFAVQQKHGLPIQIQALAPQAGFAVYMKVGLLSGVIVAIPWMLYHLWKFVASGLYPQEQRFVWRFLPASAGLFIVGVLFFYFLALPTILNFLVAFNKSFIADYAGMSGFQRMLLGEQEPSHIGEHDATRHSEANLPLMPNIPLLDHNPISPRPGDIWLNTTTRHLNVKGDGAIWSVPVVMGEQRATIASQFSVDAYTSFVLMLALAFGIAFQLPIVVLFLAWSGLVSIAVLSRSRRGVFLGIFISAAVITPTSDLISLLLLAIPMYGLFELGMVLARAIEKRRQHEGF